MPVDAVGHQFHLSLSTPIQSLEDAIVAFADLPVTQVVSELDVTTGTPVTEARADRPGLLLPRRLPRLREHADELFSVTVWGLTDGRSWRVGSGAPLVFDDELQAKPAYHGIVDGELPPRQRSAFVFRADGDLGIGADEWERLPLHAIDGAGAFQLRWRTDTLVALVRVADATPDAADRITFVVGGRELRGRARRRRRRAGAGRRVGRGLGRRGRAAALRGAIGDLVAFDVQVTDAGTTVGWNQPGARARSPSSSRSRTRRRSSAPVPPAIDGEIDGVWSLANSVSTDVAVLGADGATAGVRTLWRANTLYVLAEVTDATPDVSGSDPWVQDSLEIFLDAGNAKNGPYRFDDTQIRISAENVTSFGTGDVAFQEARLESETALDRRRLRRRGGREPARVRRRRDLPRARLPGQRRHQRRQDLDPNWADPTGLGYQSTSRWGVAKLVETDARAQIAAVIASLRDACTRRQRRRRGDPASSSGRSPPLWSDGTHLRAPAGAAVFDHLAAAVTSSGSASARGRTRRRWRRRRGISSRWRGCSR